jgi:hypothetical protein
MVFRFGALLLSLTVILGLHVISVTTEYNWYNQFWWLDWMLHFAGGAWAAYLFIVLSRYRQLLAVVSFVFLVGIGWEVLEYMFDVPFFGVGEASFSDSLWILDTLKDLFCAVAAALLVALLANRYTKDNV